ncbi:DUF5071 domain-containing protein [Paenibacillus macerans]|uniref:DUF5071 domain-containing protein n=1 Tax=Paenibacillus macerans TaxID=44252 RepID=UPI002040385D|nr:DUF5071 domain-containing protein [Paenibacillus macerans]MCM3702483.1 DUF5071 domain-containing protein [Paenibacillus macerans]
MNLRGYLPKDKMDLEGVAHLKTLSSNELIPLIPDLIEWLQDINWPVASELSKLLMPMEDELIPHIKEIVNSNDSQWKYCILSNLVRNFTTRNKVRLKDELMRLSNNPNNEDIKEEIDNLAKEILNSMD